MGGTYCGAGDDQLNLPSVRTHEHAELLYNTLKSTQPVVRGKCGQEVLDNALLVLRSNVLLELRDNLLLVRDGKRRGSQDLSELGVLLEQGREGFERLCGRVEDVGFRSGRVLCVVLASSSIFQPLSAQFHPMSSSTSQLQIGVSYQSACVCSIDAEEGNGGLVGRAGGRGGGVASNAGNAGSNGGAGRTRPESGAEGTSCRHGG